MLFSLRQIGLMMFIGLMICIIPSVSASEASIIQSIIKIKTYTVSDDGAFVFTSYGSAIAISPSRILTNAHVILDANSNPTGKYEVCISQNFESVPRCTDVARLIAYDVVADLAILELEQTTTLIPFVLSHNKIAIGSYVSMYGYPGIGGETITRTEGKIAGYEQGMYKIDGSIDHGNSGGGAFNNSGELLGIPTAVASDNASIGYMIPVKRIEEFLMKKTPSYEIYTGKVNRDFIRFIQKNQSYNPDSSGYRFKGIQIKNPRPYGFKLKSIMISRNDNMLYWSFSDTYDRVKFNFVCTDDAGKILGWQARLAGLIEEQKLYPSWDIRVIDDMNFLTVYSSSKGYNPGIVLYYKNYDACYVDLDYQDAKKDANSLKRALKFIKQAIVFHDSYILKSEQENPFFSIKNIDKNTRIIRSIDKLGNESVSLGFEIEAGKWLNGTIEGKKYMNLSDLSSDLGVDFDDIKTWTNYIAVGIKNGIESSRIDTVDLGAGKKGVIYSLYNPDKKNTTVNFEYTYQLPDASYAYWNWSASFAGDAPVDITKLKKFFQSLTYPGQSFLR